MAGPVSTTTEMSNIANIEIFGDDYTVDVNELYGMAMASMFVLSGNNLYLLICPKVVNLNRQRQKPYSPQECRD